MAATLAWGRRGINLNTSVWHLNVSRELLLDLRDTRVTLLQLASTFKERKIERERDSLSLDARLNTLDSATR